MFALTNARIYDFEDYAENAYVVFDDKIRDIGPMEGFRHRGGKNIDCKGKLVTPGLAALHTHIYSTFARGMQVPFNPLNFQDILDQLWWKLDAAMTKDDIFMSGLVSGAGFAKNGVTSVVDHHASGTVRGSLDLLRSAVCEKTGLRALFCFETSDRFDVGECLDENIESGDMFGLHASLSLSEETLKKVKLVLGDRPIHIHAAESAMDQEDCICRFGERVVERLHRHGLLNEGSILSHCIHIDGHEADLIADSGCFVALNISSNMNNGVGLPDYRMLKEHGVRCLLGNDGMSHGMAGEWMYLYLAMKHRYLSPTAFGIGDLMEVINNGYDFINQSMEIKTGRLRKGYEADLQVLEYEPPTPMNGNNAMGHLLFGLSGNFTPEHVWCGGRQVVDHYNASDGLKKDISTAADVAAKLWEKINGGQA